jgi:ABC-type phosphate transport system substrate-binding protein
MKKVRQFCAAVVLTLIFALSAFAGQMTTWVADPPPPPPSEGNMSTPVAQDPSSPSAAADGRISTPVAGQIQTGGSVAVDPVTQMAMNLLQGVLSLL